jgi:hypothetical protein
MPGKLNTSRAVTKLTAEVYNSFVRPTSRSMTTHHQTRQLLDATFSTGKSLDDLYQQASTKTQRVIVNFGDGDEFMPNGTQTVGALQGHRQHSLFKQFATIRMQADELRHQMQHPQEDQRPTKRK